MKKVFFSFKNNILNEDVQKYYALFLLLLTAYFYSREPYSLFFGSKVVYLGLFWVFFFIYPLVSKKRNDSYGYFFLIVNFLFLYSIIFGNIVYAANHAFLLFLINLFFSILFITGEESKETMIIGLKLFFSLVMLFSAIQKFTPEFLSGNFILREAYSINGLYNRSNIFKEFIIDYFPLYKGVVKKNTMLMEKLITGKEDFYSYNVIGNLNFQLYIAKIISLAVVVMEFFMAIGVFIKPIRKSFNIILIGFLVSLTLAANELLFAGILSFLSIFTFKENTARFRKFLYFYSIACVALSIFDKPKPWYLYKGFENLFLFFPFFLLVYKREFLLRFFYTQKYSVNKNVNKEIYG